jgi:hypothetical protein
MTFLIGRDTYLAYSSCYLAGSVSWAADDSIALLSFSVTGLSCHHDFALVFVANFVLLVCIS